MLISERQIEDFDTRLRHIRQELSRARARSEGQRFLDRMDRSRSWLDRAATALRDYDDEQTFIALWIALNALYGVPKDRKLKGEAPDELERIGEYIGLLKDTDSEALRSCLAHAIRNVNIRGFLSLPYLIDANWTGNIEDFKRGPKGPKRVLELYRDGEAGKVLEAVLGRIYVLRKQIFHGCATNNRGTNRGSLFPSIKLLVVIVPGFWNIMMEDGNHLKWGKLPYPRATA
ncbi:MAG: hypothetical protein E6K64_09550 [Nitrospirae bacterium]|nr:MAG: hypothetical protein E6K64_09550 [Nitrospirota bacterium]